MDPEMTADKLYREDKKMKEDMEFRSMIEEAKVAPFAAESWDKMNDEERHEYCRELVKSLVEQVDSMQTKAEEKIANARLRLRQEMEAVSRKMATVQGIEHVYKLMLEVDETALLYDAARTAARFSVKAKEFARKLDFAAFDDMESVVEEVYDHGFSERFVHEYTKENVDSMVQLYIEELLNLDLARMSGNAVSDIVSFRDAASEDVRKVADNIETIVKKYPDLWSELPHGDESFPEITCPDEAE